MGRVVGLAGGVESDWEFLGELHAGLVLVVTNRKLGVLGAVADHAQDLEEGHTLGEKLWKLQNYRSHKPCQQDNVDNNLK